ncbi:MAG: hypothetical protein ACRD2X_27445 [Vicinamibacteraceae bacterium]
MSVEEFVIHAFEKETAQLEETRRGGLTRRDQRDEEKAEGDGLHLVGDPMTALKWLLARGFDGVLHPVAYLPPLAGLAFVSLVTAAAMLLVFRRTSDQRQLAAVKRAMQAVFFEIRLFSDDVPALFRAQLEMLRHTLTYLRLSLVPMLWMIVPLTLIISQLECVFAYSGLSPGRPAIVKATLRAGAAPLATASGGDSNSELSPGRVATLQTAPSIHVATPAVWFPAAGEVVWRLVPKMSGEYMLRIRVGDRVYDKTLQVSDAVVRRSPMRATGGFLNELLNASEPALPEDGPVTAITVAYPRREIRVLGWTVHWLVAYAAASIGFAFVLRRPFGVIL